MAKHIYIYIYIHYYLLKTSFFKDKYYISDIILRTHYNKDLCNIFSDFNIKKLYDVCSTIGSHKYFRTHKET